jgi:hypothetical protein
MCAVCCEVSTWGLGWGVGPRLRSNRCGPLDRTQADSESDTPGYRETSGRTRSRAPDLHTGRTGHTTVWSTPHDTTYVTRGFFGDTSHSSPRSTQHDGAAGGGTTVYALAYSLLPPGRAPMSPRHLYFSRYRPLPCRMVCPICSRVALLRLAVNRVGSHSCYQRCTTGFSIVRSHSVWCAFRLLPTKAHVRLY